MCFRSLLCKETDTLDTHRFFFFSLFMLSDTQIVIALFTALCTGILALRLGVQLYEY